MTRRVIIPAAGTAERFGGVPKELLPIGEGRTSLHHAVELAHKIGEPVIITSPAKAYLHRKLFPDVEIVLQGAMPELAGAIRSGLRRGTRGALILADTVTDFDAAFFNESMLVGGIRFGVFPTKEPHRFSVVKGRRIHTKPPRMRGPQNAWGVVGWSGLAADFMLNLGGDLHYDRIFERTMQSMPSAVFPLHYYYDLGNFEAYRNFLKKPIR